MSDLAKLVASETADLITDKSVVDHPHFFQWLDKELRERGYTLVCTQRGVFGTHIKVGKCQ